MLIIYIYILLNIEVTTLAATNSKLTDEELEVLRGISKKFLGKGIRKKRFRRALKSWNVINRYLYGLMFSEDIKVSDLAEMIGVHPRTVQRWIFEGGMPKEETTDKISDILNAPKHILFNEKDIEERKKRFAALKNDDIN